MRVHVHVRMCVFRNNLQSIHLSEGTLSPFVLFVVSLATRHAQGVGECACACACVYVCLCVRVRVRACVVLAAIIKCKTDCSLSPCAIVCRLHRR